MPADTMAIPRRYFSAAKSTIARDSMGEASRSSVVPANPKATCVAALKSGTAWIRRFVRRRTPGARSSPPSSSINCGSRLPRSVLATSHQRFTFTVTEDPFRECVGQRLMYTPAFIACCKSTHAKRRIPNGQRKPPRQYGNEVGDTEPSYHDKIISVSFPYAGHAPYWEKKRMFGSHAADTALP